MNTYKIILKSGATIDVRAESFSVTYDSTAEVNSYKYASIEEGSFVPLFIKPGEIAALLGKKSEKVRCRK